MQATQTTEKPLTQFKSKTDLLGGNDAGVDTSSAWTVPQIEALFALPFNELMFKAQQVHREY